MNVGDYVRTEDGTITRIKMFYEKKWEEPELIYARFLCEDYEIYEYPRQTKSSPNIIDLIEAGDYVNYGDIMGGLVLDKKDDEITVLTILPSKLKNKDIRSVITKEQLENHLYKLEAK